MAVPRTYRGFRVTRGDATGEQLAIILPTGYRVLHVASAADEATDWNVANPSHPTFYVHSETTPATDYVSIDHDGTDGTIDVRGGNLKLAVAGTDVFTVDATGFTIPDDGLLGIGTGQTARFSWDTTDANANELLLQLPVGGATDVPVLIIGDTIESDDLGLFNGVVSSTVAIMGSTATATGPSLNFRKSRGTNSAPTVVTSGDDMGSLDFYGAVAADEYVRGARILAEMTGTVATTRGPGILTLQTATDAAPSVLTTGLTISAAQVVDLPAGDLTIGTAGTTTGKMRLDGATSGTVTVTVAAVAGTWTMQLPAAVGAGGQQLTDAGGDGITSWAAASLGAWKNDLGILDPEVALNAVVSAPTHIFTYNQEVMPAGQWAPPDRMTGIFAEEAPWAMHGERDGLRSGIAFSNINAFGYARAAIQALAEKVKRLEVAMA